MPTQSRHTCSTVFKSEVVLSWTVHLARRYPSKAIFSVCALIFAAFIGYYAIGVLGALAAAVVILGSLSDFLFPIHYVLTADSAECRMLVKRAKISWSNVRHYYLDNEGIKLSPLHNQSRLEAFRGVYLRFNNNKEQLIETVRMLRDKSCST